jgi:hypothetical protein
MTFGFQRDLVPGWREYADAAGLELQGHGIWQTTRCGVHDGSDSLRVNVAAGGWICMACGAKGGDTLAHRMAVTGEDFAAAARALGCWVEGGSSPPKPTRLSAREALSVVGLELGVCVIVIADARAGITPTDDDWQRFLAAAGRVQFIAQEVTA